MPESFSEKNNMKNWWTMWIVTAISLIFVAGISVGIYYLYPSISMTESEGLRCLTESCLKAALEIMSSIDVTKDPCEDFYQFACGNFKDKASENNIPSPYFLQDIRNTNMLNGLIKEPVRGDERNAILQQKQFYQFCMNTEAIDQDENKTFKELLEKIGGWPIIEGQEWADNFNLTEITTKCKSVGLPFQWFFQFSFNENWCEIYIDIPQHDYGFLRDSMYLNLMVESAVQLGASRIIAINEMEKIIQFEKELENIILRNSQNAVTLMNINELDNVFPKFSWLQFLNSLMDDYTDTGSDYLTVADETYLRELNLLLAKTPNRTQANYIIWKIIQEFGFYLSTPISENFMNFKNYTKQDDKTYEDARIDYCTEEARIRFSDVAETEFLYRNIDGDKYRNIMKMIVNIKQQFVQRLRNASWIDDSTKEITINKLKNIVEIIGHKDLDFNQDVPKHFLNTYDVQFTTNNIINMVRANNINNFKNQFLSGNISSDSNMSNRTLQIHATYLEAPNTFFLSAGIVQDIFYSESRPNFLNYGALGSIIGREITHSFSKYAYDIEEEREIIIALFNETVHAIDDIMKSNFTQLFYSYTVNVTNDTTTYDVEEQTHFEEELPFLRKNLDDTICSVPEDINEILEVFNSYKGTETLLIQTYTQWLKETIENQN